MNILKPSAVSAQPSAKKLSADRHGLVKTGALLLLLLLALPSAAGPLTGTKIILDPGHGGQAGRMYNGLPGDPGALGPTGVREADCTLAIALLVRDMLAAQGATVYMTRDTDVFVSLSARTNMANALAVDRFVSFHQNASSAATANYTGTHVYLTPSANSIDLASKTVAEEDAFHKSGVVATNCDVRGVHEDNFHVVRESLMPSELIENSFVTNPGEESRLKTPTHIKGCADAIYRGLMAHLGKPVPQDHEPPVIAHTPVTSVAAGASATINATVTDASGVTDVTLWYRKKGGSILVSLPMALAPGSVYAATIDASAIGTEGVEYYITATDKAGNVAQLPSGSPVAPIVLGVIPSANIGALTGVITDKVSGAKLANVEVTLSPGGAKTLTSATGVYRFDGLAARSYTAAARLSGYLDTSASSSVDAGQTRWNSFALAAIPPTVTAIRGTVNVAAMIALKEKNLSQTGTSFDFSGLDPGTYHLSVTAAGYHAQSRTITLKQGKTSEARFYLLSPDKGILRVKVKQLNTKGVLVNAQGIDVAITGPLAMTRPTGWGSSSGEAVFDELPPGTYTIGALGLSKTIDVPKGKTTNATLSP